MDENNEKLTAAPEQTDAEEQVTQVIENATADTEEYNQEAEDTAGSVTEDAAQSAEEAKEAVEEASDAATEAFEETVPAEGAEGPDRAFGTDSEISDDLIQMQNAAENYAPVKKKRKLMGPIIISIVIVAVAAVAALVLKVFFNTGIEGSWYYEREVQTGYAESTNDEPPTMKLGYYFIFEGNGKMTVKSGTVSGSGTYTYRTGSVEGEPIGKPVVDINYIDPLYRTPVNTSMAVEVTGNIFTGKTLKLSAFENASQAVTLTQKNYEKPELKREGDFVADKELEGKWVNGEASFNISYTTTYDIKSDGTMSVSSTQTVNGQLSGTGKDQEYTVTIDCIYSTNKGKLEIMYNAGENQKQELPYSLSKKGDVLTIKEAQEINLYKVGSASADEIMDKISKSTQATEAAPQVTQAAAEAETKAKE